MRSGFVQNQPQKMKTKQIVQFTVVAVALALGLPARADTMSVPSKEKPAFTLDVPSDWKPTGNPADENVEATAPGDHAYLSAWIVKAADEKALVTDLDATLKDAMKSIDADPKQHELDQNGSHFFVISGSGVDKRAGQNHGCARGHLEVDQGREKVAAFTRQIGNGPFPSSTWERGT
jgi:hypothetical protein